MNTEGVSKRWGRAIFGTGKKAGRWLLDVVLPPLCLKCRMPVSEPQSICALCWAQLRFLGAPCCVQCGLPFPHDLGAEVKCGVCIGKPQVFSWMRSAVAYDDASRDLILGFKHADKLENAPLFARWMYAATRDRLSDADMLVPVPLHWRRLAQRRYNQAGLLAQGMGKLASLPVEVSLLRRVRATASQGEMVSARARLKNVAGVFSITEAQKPILSGKNVVLVDDVLTTGATTNACSKVLLRGGAASVSIVTLARVVRPLNFSV